MNPKRNCSCCGVELPADALSGLCAPCLLKGGLPDTEPAKLQTPHQSTTILSPTIPSCETFGNRIGRYKLLQEIGEGGMGTVWMAEQEEPVRRKVALKVIKLGMDSAQILSRFEGERQALALMDHPNIAKVLDAGATENGRPYFVMELVEGVSITQFCDGHKLNIADRLELFADVCHAVQHAHQKGVIHRDIKPGNILVAEYDGKPVAKVIDFGIAKATGAKLTEKTIFTALGAIVGTPEYMSPEQASGNSVDVDTRTDIYSLGVLLYELLTGSTPLTRESLRAAALDEILRRIRDEEPPKPSTRLQRSGDLLTTASESRRTSAHKLTKLVSGDLDWIVMKALDKDRSRRYETANGLALDIGRYLQNEPVVARPPSNIYRWKKLIRRHKLVFGAGAAVVMALLAGLGLSTWLFLRERDARHRAVAAEQAAEAAKQLESKLRKQAETNETRARDEAAKSQQVAQFLGDMLRGVGPSVAAGRDTTMLREILDKTAERVGRDLTNRPQVESQLRDTIGQVYRELGDYNKAEEMHRTSLAKSRQVFGNNDLAVAVSLNNLAMVLDDQGKLAEAEETYREAMSVRKAIRANAPPDMADSSIENNLGLVLQRQGKLGEAEAVFRHVLVFRQNLLGSDNPKLAGPLSNLAGTLGRQGKLAEAEQIQREALAMRRRSLGNRHPEVAQSLKGLAETLLGEGKVDEAASVCNEALDMRKAVLGNEHPDVARSLVLLGQVLRAQGKLSQSESVHREALAMRRKLLGPEHMDVATSLNDLAGTLLDQGKLGEADGMFRESLTMRLKALGPSHTWTLQSFESLARALCDGGKYVEAEKLLDDPVMSAIATNRSGASVLRVRAEYYARRKRWSEASAVAAKAVELAPQDDQSYHTLAAVLAVSGNQQAFRLHSQQALRNFSAAENPDVAGRIAVDCLILPEPGVDLESVSRLAEIAIRSGTDGRHADYFNFAKGFVAYRQGDFSSAASWAQKALAKPRSSSLEAGAWLVLALAQANSKHPEEASAAQSKAMQIIESSMPPLAGDDLGYAWKDWTTVQSLLRESLALSVQTPKPQ